MTKSQDCATWEGTVLGPLLFLIYINDLPEYVSPGTEVKLFADDSALFRKIKSQNDHNILQTDINNLVIWEQTWSMEFHPDKCQLLNISNKKSPSLHTYTIHNSHIQPISNAKYLGITINNKLSWNTHIDITCQKANNTLNFINRNFRNTNMKIKEQLYMTHIRPILEYCSSVWDPHTQDNKAKLEKVQRRAARFIHNTYSREVSVTSLLKKLHWTPLEERRTKTKVTLMFKAIKNTIHIPTDHLKFTLAPTRQQQNFFIPYARTNTYRHSFFPDTIRHWNKTPTDMRNSDTTEQFQKQISALTYTHSY